MNRVDILIVVLFLIMCCCTEDDMNEDDFLEEESGEIYVGSLFAFDILCEKVCVEGYINDEENQVIEHGIYYHNSPESEKGNKISLGKLGPEGHIETTIENLEPSSPYYTRAYAYDGNDYFLGNEIGFVTAEPYATIEADTIINTGLYKPDPECFGGPFNIYYLKLTYEDPYGLIDKGLSNVDYLVTWDDNDVGGSGCLAYWFPKHSDFFKDYPINVTSNTIHIPFGCSLGDNNSDACYVRVYFVDQETGEKVSYQAMFSIVRGVNY